MDKENKLFLVDVKRHDFYVVAKSFDNAVEVLKKKFAEADYGYLSDDDVESVEVLAVERYFPEGKQTFCGEKSNLVIGDLGAD